MENKGFQLAEDDEATAPISGGQNTEEKKTVIAR